LDQGRAPASKVLVSIVPDIPTRNGHYAVYAALRTTMGLTRATICGIIRYTDLGVLGMPSRKRSENKRKALKDRGLLNPRPESVTDPLFSDADFFDPRDLLQVKYEMIRKVEIDGAAVATTAKAFGVSRPSIYNAQSAFARAGFPGLLPRKRGPHGGHKLGQEILDFLDEVRSAEPSLSASALVKRVDERFGVSVHIRTMERALRRLGKKNP
jgi:transposase